MASEQKREQGSSYVFLGTLVAGYIGIYLCRKNLTVAVPLLQSAWGLTKDQVGIIGSVSTVCYAAGKILFGPLTDRLGGRTALLGSMLLVTLLGAAGALAPSFGVLVVFYSLTRLCGAASWGAMLKLVPEWFAPSKLASACGLLSLSYVFGGAIAVGFGGLVAQFTHDSWRAVLCVPSAVLLLLAAGCWAILPRPIDRRSAPASASTATKEGFQLKRLAGIFAERRFLVVLALSFTLTLLRETFNFWTVDFIRTEGGRQISSSVAAMLATPFDVCGAVGIVLMGAVFGHLQPAGRKRLLIAVLLVLSVLLATLPSLFHIGLWALGIGVGLIGFLVYGPYSLLGGVLSVEVRGKDYAATVSGLVDGIGYVAGFLSGIFFGKIVMAGGYRLGFQVMAGVTFVSAILSGFLYQKSDAANPAAASPAPDTVVHESAPA